MVAINNLLAIASLALSVNASDGWSGAYKYDVLAWKACTGYTTKVATFFSKKDKAGYCNVKNQPALGTIAHCIRQLPAHQQGAERLFIENCQKYNLTEKLFQAAYDNATNYLILNPKKNDPKFNSSVVYNRPIQYTNKQVSDAYHANTGRFINHNRAVWYGIALISYWFLILLITGIARGFYFIFPGFVNKFTGPITNCLRKHIFLPALGKKDHIQHKSFGKYIVWVLPTRWETIMVSGWIILAVIFNAVGYRSDENNYIFPTKPNEIGRKIADRTGIMVLFLIPQLILFAGRNNFMQWLSGWTYSRFIYVHKWIAKISILLVMMHAIGMTYNAGGFHAAKYLKRNTQAYVIWGYVAMIGGFIMMFQATYSIKRLNYEIFLIIHQFFAIFFIAGGWIHCEYVGYQNWYYAATAVWAFDRLVRIIRLISFGIRPATVQLIANETVKVTVTRPKHWKTFPGCHAFIHFIRPTCFWQSHPFTLVDEVVDNGANTITFYLKVKGGVTHGLYKYLASQPENKATIKVTIEGPYGQRLPLDRYDTAVFLTGGNGIPGLYYQARDIVKNNSNKTRVKFYWVIRHYKSIEWFYPELQKLKDSSIETVIYVSQPHVELLTPIASHTSGSSGDSEKDGNSSGEIYEKEPEDNTTNLRNKLSFIEFREGRPDIDELVKKEIEESNGSIAFTTCAHATMVDDARKSIADNLNLTKNRVELFEQIQGW